MTPCRRARSGPRPGRLAPRGGEHGYYSAELVVLTPMLVGLFLFVAYLGCLAGGKQQMDDLTRVAAESAVLHDRWSDAASSATEESQQQADDDPDLRCPDGWLSLDGSQWEPGGSVAVTASCSIVTAGIFPGAPASVPVTSSAVAPISPYHAVSSAP